MTTITKAALAAELGVTPSRVSQYVKNGLPVRSDGKLDRDRALQWLSENGRPGKDQNKGPAVAIELVRRRKPKAPRPDAEQFRPPPFVDRFRSPVSWEPALLDPIENQFDRGAAYAVMAMFYRLGHMVGVTALHAGAPVQVAFALSRVIPVAFLDAATDVLRAAGCEPVASDPEGHPRIQPEAELQTDWIGTAANFGMKFDQAACEAHLAETFGDLAREDDGSPRKTRKVLN